MRVLNAYAAMLPRLRAEESMRRVTEGQVASGALTPESADEIWGAWRDAAYPGEEEAQGDDPFWP